LRKNYRFQEQPGIATLASAIREQDTERALRTLEDPTFPDVLMHPLDSKNLALLELLAPYLQSCLAAATVEEAFALLSRFRILSPTRRGRHGVERINSLVEQEISRLHNASSPPGSAGTGTIDPRLDPWYRGRPVLITANDYQAQLFNGDLGVCWPEEGRRHVWFSTPEGTLRAFLPARLPKHETAWAMTVHKSQGSELEKVVLVLPENDSPILSRELLYTAVTRARKQVWVVGTGSSLAAAIERRNRRRSGLAEALAPQRVSLAESPGVSENTVEGKTGQLSLF
jgi:exodeoxyribonuclease V alpha subunit